MTKTLFQAFWSGFLCGLSPFTWISWVLYCLGQAAGNMEQRHDRAFWHPIYNRLMLWSLHVQGKSKCGPWTQEGLG